MPKDVRGGKQADLEGHDDVVEVKNKEEALIAAEARYTELNGRFEEGLSQNGSNVCFDGTVSQTNAIRKTRVKNRFNTNI